MSLRMVHLSFISMAIIFCLGTSYRSFQLAELQSTMPFQTMGGVSLLAAVLLLVYSAWCLKNRNTNLLPGLLLGISLMSTDALACGVCYGDGNHAMAQSANDGGLIMLGLGVGMLVAYGALGYLWSRRAMSS